MLAADEALSEIKQLQQKYALPEYIQNAKPASQHSTHALKKLDEKLKDVARRYLLVQRKKKILEFATTNKADCWMQKETELVRKEARLAEMNEGLAKQQSDNQQTLVEISSMLKQLVDGDAQLKAAKNQVQEMKTKYAAMVNERERLLNVEKVFEKKSPVEIETMLQELQNKRNDLEQILRQRVAIRDDKKQSLESLEQEVSELSSSVEYLTEKAKSGKETAEKRIQKRDAIRGWYEKVTQILSNMLGFTVRLDKDAHSIISDFGDASVTIVLDRQSAQISNILQTVEFPIDDLVTKAKSIDDFGWLLRQIHHRHAMYGCRQKEINQLIDKGYNLIYNMRQTPDTVLVVIDQGVFAFKLLDQGIQLISAESTSGETLKAVKESIDGVSSVGELLTLLFPKQVK